MNWLFNGAGSSVKINGNALILTGFVIGLIFCGMIVALVVVFVSNRNIGCGNGEKDEKLHVAKSSNKKTKKKKRKES